MKTLNRIHCLVAVIIGMTALAALVCANSESSPLYLTPMIKDGRLREARRLSRVTHFGRDLKSHSGYLTVNETYSSNMFFWFFPAENNARGAPLLLWLNGGPGVGSTTGVFLENGPLRYVTSGEFVRSNVSWTTDFNMLYIDNPVGAGYSYTLSDDGYPTSMADVKINLYEALKQFFKLFPKYAGNKFYIGGQSYAGKYVPSIAHYVHEQNLAGPSEDYMNLAGIFLGGAMCDQTVMYPEYGGVLYHSGILSPADRENHDAQVKALVSKGRSDDPRELLVVYAFRTHTIASDGDINILLGSEFTNFDLTFQLEETLFSEGSSYRQALHVGDASGLPQFLKLFLKLTDDFFQNTRAEHEVLMENYKVLHYTGNLDLLIGIPMTEAFLDTVSWSGRDEYRNASRSRWRVGNDALAGWYTKVDKFLRVIVRNAGHMVPYDQPEAALQMMKSFILDEPFEEEFQYDWMQGWRP